MCWCYLQTGRFECRVYSHRRRKHTNKHSLCTRVSLFTHISINITPPAPPRLFLGHLHSSALTEIFQLTYIHSFDTHTFEALFQRLPLCAEWIITLSKS